MNVIILEKQICDNISISAMSRLGKENRRVRSLINGVYFQLVPFGYVLVYDELSPILSHSNIT